MPVRAAASANVMTLQGKEKIPRSRTGAGGSCHRAVRRHPPGHHGAAFMAPTVAQAVPGFRRRPDPSSKPWHAGHRAPPSRGRRQPETGRRPVLALPANRGRRDSTFRSSLPLGLSDDAPRHPLPCVIRHASPGRRPGVYRERPHHGDALGRCRATAQIVAGLFAQTKHRRRPGSALAPSPVRLVVTWTHVLDYNGLGVVPVVRN